MAGPNDLAPVDDDAHDDDEDRPDTHVGVSGAGGGPGSWAPGGWGPGGFGGPGGHGGRGTRPTGVESEPGLNTNRTGPDASQSPGGSHNVLAALLLLLDEWPMAAPQLVRMIAQRSGELWAPGLDLVHVGLSALEDAGMVTTTRADGRSAASLTPCGVGFVDQQREALGEPWDELEGSGFAPTASQREALVVRPPGRIAPSRVARPGEPAGGPDRRAFGRPTA
jgi:DNA-binding PadR family transcriptional regulator